MILSWKLYLNLYLIPGFMINFIVFSSKIKDNIIELKHRKLEHSKQMGMLDMNLKPDPINKNLLNVN